MWYESIRSFVGSRRTQKGKQENRVLQVVKLFVSVSTDSTAYHFRISNKQHKQRQGTRKRFVSFAVENIFENLMGNI